MSAADWLKLKRLVGLTPATPTDAQEGQVRYSRDGAVDGKLYLARKLGAGTFEWAVLTDGAPDAATYITQTPNATLTAEQALSLLTTGFMQSTTATGVVQTRLMAVSSASGGIALSNADGSAGNPTFSLAAILEAIAALASTGMIARTGSGTVAVRTLASTSSGLVIANGDGVAGAPSFSLVAAIQALAGLTPAADRLAYYDSASTAALATFTSFGRSLVDDADATAARSTLGVVIGTNVQAWDADLDAIAALAGTAGLLAKTAANTWALRTLTAPAAGITVTNGDGVSGNPTLALANDLSALEGLGSTGFAVRTGADTWAQRSFTGGSGIDITNATGVGGDVSIAVNATVIRTTSKLSALAATSSSELAGVISDETGSGALVFGTRPTLSLQDTLTTFQDDGDNTKQAKLDLANITTATTRTYKTPNANGGLALIDAGYRTPPGPVVIDATSVTALASQQCGARFLCQVPYDCTSVELNFRVTTGAATITWAEVAIASGASATSGNLTLIGSATNVAATFNSTGNKTVTITATIPAGTFLYALYGSQATTPFQVRATLADELGIGVVRLASTTRPSTMAAPTSFSSSTAITGAAWCPFRLVPA